MLRSEGWWAGSAARAARPHHDLPLPLARPPARGQQAGRQWWRGAGRGRGLCLTRFMTMERPPLSKVAPHANRPAALVSMDTLRGQGWGVAGSEEGRRQAQAQCVQAVAAWSRSSSRSGSPACPAERCPSPSRPLPPAGTPLAPPVRTHMTMPWDTVGFRPASRIWAGSPAVKARAGPEGRGLWASRRAGDTGLGWPRCAVHCAACHASEGPCRATPLPAQASQAGLTSDGGVEGSRHPGHELHRGGGQPVGCTDGRSAGTAPVASMHRWPRGAAGHQLACKQGSSAGRGGIGSAVQSLPRPHQDVAAQAQQVVAQQADDGNLQAVGASQVGGAVG